MRAVTLWPEWAWCIRPEPGWKHVENRTWQPWASCPFGSRLAVHAGATVGGSGAPVWEQRHILEELLESLQDFELLTGGEVQRLGREWMLKEGGVWRPLATSSVVAVVTLEGCDVDGRSRWDGADCYHWRLADIQRLAQPVPCVGRQGLWWLPKDVEHQVLEQLGTTR